MRLSLSTVAMDGVVVIGEGEKDHAPMLYNGEHVGDGSAPDVDVAVDPIDGTTLTAQGKTNALAVIAVADRGSMLDPGPSFYMEKIAVGPDAVGSIDITATATQNLRWIAKAKGEEVRDLTVVILDRPRHADLIREVRESGARIRLITDGDVYGSVATCWPDAGADVLFVEAPESETEVAEVAAAFPDTPLLFNWVERGRTPMMTLERVAELGFALVLFPVATLFSATTGMQRYLAELRATGTPLGALDDAVSFDEFTDLVGLPEIRDFERSVTGG